MFKAHNRHEQVWVSPGPISLTQVPRTEAKSTEKHGGAGPYAGADYNLSLCPLQSRL
jgi:hypothetical protein